jgi:hypothetical protein
MHAGLAGECYHSQHLLGHPYNRSKKSCHSAGHSDSYLQSQLLRRLRLGGIVIWGQLEQKVHKTLSQPMAGCGGVLLSSQLQGKPKIEKLWLTPARAYTWDGIWNIAKAKRAGGMVQGVKRWPSEHEALSSNPGLPKNKQKSCHSCLKIVKMIVKDSVIT